MNKETDESFTQSIENIARNPARLPYKDLYEKKHSVNIKATSDQLKTNENILIQSQNEKFIKKIN